MRKGKKMTQKNMANSNVDILKNKKKFLDSPRKTQNPTIEGFKNLKI